MVDELAPTREEEEMVAVVADQGKVQPSETASRGVFRREEVGHLCNGQGRILKALHWDRTGFCLWMKRLEPRGAKIPGEGE